MEYIVVGIFTALIVWCFVAGVRRPKLRGAAPALLTTLGVLGTFVGIFIGLLDFNVQGIKESIPSLLDGLKIAFATSIIGMFAGVLFKVLSSLGVFGEGASQGEVGPGEIHGVLVDVREAAIGQKDALGDLRKAIAGDSDDTLLTQLKNLRTEMGDNSKKLISEFQEFAQKMAENNSQALIEALENVMRDFNAKINEQFGDNFKQLNEAVGKLVVWQENYRQQMDVLEKQIEAVTNNLQSSSESLTQIVEKTTALPKTLESLEPLLAEARQRMNELEEHLKAIASLGEKAQNAFPEIENNLKQMTEGMAAAVEESVSQSQAAVEAQAESVKQLKESIQETQDDFEKEIKNHLKQVTEGMAAAVEESVSQSQAAVAEQTESVRQLRASIQGTQAALEKEIEAALTTAVQQMGKRLGTLAEALGNEYSKVNQAVESMTETISRLNGRQ